MRTMVELIRIIIIIGLVGALGGVVLGNLERPSKATKNGFLHLGFKRHHPNHIAVCIRVLLKGEVFENADFSHYFRWVDDLFSHTISKKSKRRLSPSRQQDFFRCLEK